ncbi:glycosyl hydrolase, glucoamylase [Corynebacterium mustelae]|uniref:Glycosyl hydrolase, glucoamylase n=1 Tax=Corynebacterium mustelae TaxID=571915 RepID=A0A0G3H1J8_9CORY|nr:glycoside hydrolase family 15 protein [Corynebacterium mustelae]AKK07286.1 glycosyl hydrolase, glucoamylase [Corynebacterium mustelae]
MNPVLDGVARYYEQGESVPLEDYGLLSNHRTVALCSRYGSIDWLCPQVDGEAIFAALVGTSNHGCWRVSLSEPTAIQWEYEKTNSPYPVLRTTWTTETGVAVLRDTLAVAETGASIIIRELVCVEGDVTVQHDLRPRINYGLQCPAWQRHENELDVYEFFNEDGILESTFFGRLPTLVSDIASDFYEEFSLSSGDEQRWELVLTATESDNKKLAATFVEAATDVSASSTASGMAGKWEILLNQSVTALKALCLANGAVLAAPTASLPEDFGGERNWDYRYCWLRDSAFSIEALLIAQSMGLVDATGYARRWRDWLCAVIGEDVDKLRIMYGVRGETNLDERILAHLPGYERSLPVRIGNGAVEQYQADVVGELMLVLAKLREYGIEETPHSWRLQKKLLDYCDANFERRDHGIWEMRGELHYFTHGRVMMWAAFNAGITAVETYPELAEDADVAMWRRRRIELREEIISRGFDEKTGTFLQTYEGQPRSVDASLLQIPQTGFIDASDLLMQRTVTAIEQNLKDIHGDSHGLIYRYRTDPTGTGNLAMDGLSGHEYPFLICNFWLVEQYAAAGRIEDAEKLMDQLASYATDLGFLAEEYDPEHGRLAGNYPQAFSHIGVIRAIAAINKAKTMKK